MVRIKSIVGNNFSDKTCILRLDLNIPLSEDGEILDDTRILESIPTIDYLINQSAKVIIISHIGRPKGKFNKNYSFKPLIQDISKRINREIFFIEHKNQSKISTILDSQPSGTLFLLDNVRFNEGEENSNPDFIDFLSSFSDVFINDGFGTIHRNHSSITGITNKLPSFGGILLEKEIINITECISAKSSNSTAILGGSKISDKIPIIENLSNNFEKVIITGGMIRPFLIASDKLKQKNISEIKEEIFYAEKILQKHSQIYVPEQLVCSENINEEPIILHSSQINDSDLIFDIGPNSIDDIGKMILESDKIIWNGPPGVYENKNFSNGTKKLINFIVNSKSKLKVAGGGSTVASINYYKASDYFSHISTGGGAFLRLLEGKFLEGIEVLKDE